MPEWTGPQRDAHSARGGNLLCSAAAGAGKTAVLAERVVGLLADAREPASVTDLLVITFTRAAAAEMRRRIAERLRERAGESAHLARQLWLLPEADITTVHGCCERLLRRAFAEVGADPGFTILDPAEARLHRDRCLNEALETRYAAGDDAAAFAATVAHYGGRRLDAALRPMALRLHDFARSQDDPAGWLRRQADLLSEPGVGVALGVAQQRFRTCRRRTERALALAPDAYRPALEADLELIDRLEAARQEGWDRLAVALRSYSHAKLAARDRDADQVAAERVRALRDATKADLKSLREGPWGRPLAEHLEETPAVAARLRPLLALVVDLEAAYSAAKARQHALDFGDLEHEALAVLRSPAGVALAGRYREVLVDECQDLSPVQDALLDALCGPARLFTVGDARQSIYGFRLAEPRRFLQRAQAYTGGGRGRRIELPHNFRSRPSVIGAVNFLFDALFTAAGADLPAAEAGPLVAAAPYPAPDPPLELCLLEAVPGLEEERSRPEREAAAVADLVARWLAEGTVYDPATGTRPARPGDVAVLLRAVKGVGAAYVDALRTLGLPAWAPSGGGRANTPEGRAVLAWLRVLDNPQQDIPLAATLRGPFGRFSDADLARLRLAGRGSLWRCLRAAERRSASELDRRVAAWLRALAAWRTEARRGAYVAPLATLLETSGYLAFVGAQPGGAERRRNLEWCLQRCREAERLSLGELISLLEGGEGGETVAEASTAAGDAVRVLTVHGAKGLEFPFVVVAGLGQALRFPDATGDVISHRDAGVGGRAVDPHRRLKWPTLRHAAVAARLRADGRAEELRVLYVALTRARERLALVGSVRRLEERAAEWLATRSSVPDLADGSTPLDWLVPVLARHGGVADAVAALPGPAPADPGPRPFPVQVSLNPEPAPPARAQRTTGAPAAPDPAVPSRLEEEAAWRYPWAAAGTVPAKLAVRDVRDRFDPGGAEEEAASEWAVFPSRPLAERGAPPRLARPGRAFRLAARRPSAAEAGTATHLLLRHLDLAGACDRAAIERRIEELVERELLEARLASSIDSVSVARLLDRPLGLRLRAAAAAGRLRREVPFAMRLGAPHPAAGEWVLVQGVVDALIVEPERLTVVDYKTDRLRASEDDLAGAVRTHRAQVSLYSRAVAAAWSRPVAEAWLAFLTIARDALVPL